MDVVKEDMKVCHRLKWRQLIGCGRPKDQETVAVFFFTAARQSLKIRCQENISGFFHLQKIMFDREKNIKITQTVTFRKVVSSRRLHRCPGPEYIPIAVQ